MLPRRIQHKCIAVASSARIWVFTTVKFN
jgi:hypothetical protein